MPESNIFILNIAGIIRIASIKLVIFVTELIRTKQLSLLKILFFKILN